MTRTATARVAGATFLLYIALGLTAMALTSGLVFAMWLLIKGVAAPAVVEADRRAFAPA